jgi:hypothetical protein
MTNGLGPSRRSVGQRSMGLLLSVAEPKAFVAALWSGPDCGYGRNFFRWDGQSASKTAAFVEIREHPRRDRYAATKFAVMLFALCAQTCPAAADRCAGLPLKSLINGPDAGRRSPMIENLGYGLRFRHSGRGFCQTPQVCWLFQPLLTDTLSAITANGAARRCGYEGFGGCFIELP